MNDELQTNQEVKPKKGIWQKIKNLSKVKKIIGGIALLITLCGIGYAIYELGSSTKENKVKSQDIIAIKAKDQIFSLQCTKTTETDIECILGYETYANNGLKILSGEIKVSKGVKIKEVTSNGSTSFSYNNGKFKASKIKEGYTSLADDIVIINLEIDEISEETYILVSNLTALAKDGKYYEYDEVEYNFAQLSNKDGIINIYRIDMDGSIFYAANRQKYEDEVRELLYTYKCQNKVSCNYDGSNLHDNGEILITDGDKIFSYNTLTKETINYDLGKEVANVSYSYYYPESNDLKIKKGLIVKYISGKQNYYLLKENKLIFTSALAEDSDIEITDSNILAVSSDSKTVLKYDINNKQIKYYQLQGDIDSIEIAVINYGEYGPQYTDSGVKVYFADGKQNYYSFVQEKYLFAKNIDEINTINNKYVVGYDKNKLGIVSADGENIIPIEYDTITYNYGGIMERIDYFEENGTTYFILAKNMKYGVIDENNKVIIDFKYENLFYSNTIKKIYSNIYEKTTFISPCEDEEGDCVYDASDLYNNNFIGDSNLKKIDFYSLNGSLIKSININDNARYSAYPTILCNGNKCYLPYFFNELDSGKYLRIFGSNAVYDIDSNLNLITRNNVSIADCGMDCVDAAINDYIYIKEVEGKYYVYNLSEKKIINEEFSNFYNDIYFDGYVNNNYYPVVYLLLCKQSDSECGAIDEKGNILVDFKYKLNDNFCLVDGKNNIIKIK